MDDDLVARVQERRGELAMAAADLQDAQAAAGGGGMKRS
jgi:hypothetical protein